jgi:hypothetical protein
MEYYKNGNVFTLLSKASEDRSDSNEPAVQQEVRTFSDCRHVLTCAPVQLGCTAATHKCMVDA